MEYSVKFILIYLFLQIALTLGGYFFYYSFIKRIYLKKQKLSFFTGFSQVFIFLSHALLLYLPYYLYTSWPQITVGKIQYIIGLSICICASLIIFAGCVNLGPFSKTMGINSNKLITQGLYRFSRNPQLIGYSLLIISYTTLWPSWYMTISIASYGIIIHRMVLTEEIHLENLFGEDYKEYCKTIPRYFFQSNASREDAKKNI